VGSEMCIRDRLLPVNATALAGAGIWLSII
jgi:hypothetical protein